jgi:pectate lyase
MNMSNRFWRIFVKVCEFTSIAVAGALTPCSPAVANQPGVMDRPCPPGAVSLPSGTSIQAAVDGAREGTAFCLKNGIHRIQAIRPKQGQRFYGEGRTVLNGSRLLTGFRREGQYWVAAGQNQHGQRHGDCAKATPYCNMPEALFIDDRPLVPVRSKSDLHAGSFFIDYGSREIYVLNDPTGHKVEATVAAFAFASSASNVLISNVTVEKYSSVAQKGAIDSQSATGWTIEHCEIRFNSAAAIGVGNGSRVENCNIHQNGQIGITGAGDNITIENNQVWANNIRGFSTGWEAGGIKLAEGDRIQFLNNSVRGNFGPGLWCDINCRNVLYEGNIIEENYGTGLLHEISFNAIIRHNTIRHNALGDHHGWFWDADIIIAGSQGVKVYKNTLTVSPEKCGIMLIDQSRPFEGHLKGKGKYKTSDNNITDNEITFDGPLCAGGASDAEADDEQFSIITDGNNFFDRNRYRVPRRNGIVNFAWGHAVLDWNGVRAHGLEIHSELDLY